MISHEQTFIKIDQKMKRWIPHLGGGSTSGKILFWRRLSENWSLLKDDVTIEPSDVVSVLAAASLFQLDGLISQCIGQCFICIGIINIFIIILVIMETINIIIIICISVKMETIILSLFQLLWMRQLTYKPLFNTMIAGKQIKTLTPPAIQTF